MDTEVVIDVKDVRKQFRIYYDRGATLKERVLFKKRRQYEDHWVIKGISFQVHRGEAIGLIGENGCGKSTTLKMLTKILYPDTGTIKMNGRVSSLIELGAGFHPDMSGRENIYTNASIFGLKREEIDRRLQEIIDFSELGAYIDNPVRTYSSGMYMRLAFAVAINVDADILLIDEILAVGDAAFQTKCFNKLREIKRKGTTIVIVSHSLGQIEQICERSIWIEGGYIRAEGSPRDVHPKYLRFMSERSGPLSGPGEIELEEAETQEEDGQKEEQEKVKGQDKSTEEKRDVQASCDLSEDPDGAHSKRWGNQKIIFEDVWIENEQGKRCDRVESGRPFEIVMRYSQKGEIEEVDFGIGIFRNDGQHCYGTNTAIDQVPVSLKKWSSVKISGRIK